MPKLKVKPETEDEIEVRRDKRQLKKQISNRIDQLQQIVDAETLTNAQAQQAIKLLSRTMIQILRVLVRELI